MNVLIGFSRPKSFKIGSAVIRAWMGTPYSHVYLRVYSKYTQQWLVYQASHGMVNCLTYDNFCKHNTIVAEILQELPADALQKTVKVAQQKLGQPYGYCAILKVALAELGLRTQGDNEASYICSEFIAELFPEVAKGADTDFVTPKMLYNNLIEQEVYG